MHLLNNVHALNKELCLATSAYGIESIDSMILIGYQCAHAKRLFRIPNMRKRLLAYLSCFLLQSFCPTCDIYCCKGCYRWFWRGWIPRAQKLFPWFPLAPPWCHSHSHWRGWQRSLPNWLPQDQGVSSQQVFQGDWKWPDCQSNPDCLPEYCMQDNTATI